MKEIKIFTDGACRGNPGPGSWAVLLRYGQHEKKLSGAVWQTTNNRMELTAAIEALKVVNTACSIDFYTDSQYVQKGISEWVSNWKRKHWVKADKKPVLNADLWKELDRLVETHHIRWHWVKGHSGHIENELVDQLANEALDALLRSEGGS